VKEIFTLYKSLSFFHKMISFKHIEKSPVLRHVFLYVLVVGVTAITIAAGVGRSRQSVAEPKLRYSTNWPLKFARGKPVSTPILYCGTAGSGRGYYTSVGAFTPYDANVDDLCSLIPNYNYTSSVGIALFSVVAVALFGLRWLLKSDKPAAKRFSATLIVLGARYYYFSQTDEAAGALFDKSDHALVIATLVWLFAWDAMVTVVCYAREERKNKTYGFAVLTLVVATGLVLALLISLSVTAGVFHTADEMWAGWRDAVYFLVAAGLLASLSEYSAELEATAYQPVNMGDDDSTTTMYKLKLKAAALEEASLVF
jgi:hypothetical protein